MGNERLGASEAGTDIDHFQRIQEPVGILEAALHGKGDDAAPAGHLLFCDGIVLMAFKERIVDAFHVAVPFKEPRQLDKTVNSLEIPMKLQDSKGFQEGIARLEQQRKAKVEKGKDVSDIDEAINQYKEKIKNFPSKGQQLSEAYHKAKQDGSNPGLVKAVEDLLGKPTEQPKETTPNVEDWSRDVESKPKQDFAFSSHQRGSVRYDEKEILDNLKSNKRTEDINALGYMELQDLLGKVNKQMPKDLIGNHLFDKINAVLVNENGNAVIKLIDKKSGKINDEAFYKFKNLEDAAKTLYEVKENHRKLQLETLASLEEKGKKQNLPNMHIPKLQKKRWRNLV